MPSVAGGAGRRALRYAGILCVYVVVVSALTWPLVRTAASHLPDPVGLLGPLGWPYVSDIQHHAWGLSWLAQSLTTAPLHLFDAPIFHPAPDSLAYTEHFLGHAPVAVPVYLLSRNPVLTYNAVLLSCYLGCALTMHALVRHWTGSHAAAFAASIVYAFNARRLLPSFWLEYAGAIWLPLVPLFLERLADTRRRRYLVGLCAMLALQTLCSYYLGYAAFLAAGLSGLQLLLAGRLRPASAVLAAGAGAVAAGLIAVVSLPYMHLHAGGALPPVTLRDAETLAFRPASVAPGGHWFLGWPTIVLALVGLCRPTRSTGARAAAVFLLVGGVLLALGPYAHIGGLTVPLPFRWLHAALPGFAAVRFVVLLIATADVGLAGLVGLGTAALVAGVARGGVLATGVVAAAVAAVVAADIGSRARIALRAMPVGDALPPVYRALAAAPPGGAVLELPMGGKDDLRGHYRETLYMVLGTYHWRPLVNGYSDFAPPSYDLLSGLARRLPEPESLANLVDLAGVRWLIVHAARLAPGWALLEQHGALRRVAGDAEATLFEVALPRRRDLESTMRAALRRPLNQSLEGTPLAPLPAGALDAAARVHLFAPRAMPGQYLGVFVTVRNAATVTWPGLGVQSTGLVLVDVRFVGGTRAEPSLPDATLRLPRDLRPGETVTIEGRVGAPRAVGDYQVDVRLRQDIAGGPVSGPVRVPLTVAVPPR